MKKLISIMMVIGFLAIAGSAFAASTNRIKERCKAKWNNNPVMTQHCYNAEVEAAHNTAEYFVKYVHKYDALPETDEVNAAFMNDQPAQIVLYCMEKWEDKEYDTYNFMMVEHCIESQLDLITE
jgi:hypothetical protein